MTWFAAHIVMFVKLKDKRQRRFSVWENIILIEAETEAQAFQKAGHRGWLEEGDDDGTFRWGWPTGGVGFCRCPQADRLRRAAQSPQGWHGDLLFGTRA